MKLNDSAPGAAPCGEPIWANEARAVATAWLTSFGQSILALRKESTTFLFHPQAVVFGALDSGLGPCTEFDALQFALVTSTAKIAPLDRAYTLITIEWIIRPVLPEAPTEHGDATFVLYTITPRYGDGGKLIVKGSVTCVHAHYSRRPVEIPSRLIKGRG